MLKVFIFAILFFLSSNIFANPLTIHQTNTRYFTDETGRAIYLTGSHTWSNWADMDDTDPPAAFDFNAFLNFIVSNGHNHFRLWGWAVPHNNSATFDFNYCNLFPWERTGPGHANDGKLKFDFDTFDTDYFGRLRARVLAAKAVGVYVSIVLFEFSILEGLTTTGFPFHTGNNINGIESSGTKAYQVTSGSIFNIQKAYIEEVVDTVNDLDNVLYEICNEGNVASKDWQLALLSYLQTYQSGKPNQHPIGLTGTWVTGDDWLWASSSSADYVSPGGTVNDWDDAPPVNNGSKIVLLDTDHIGNDLTVPWLWMAFTRGHNPIYMDSYGYGPELGDQAGLRANMGYSNSYAKRINLVSMTPSTTLCSTQYCLANNGYEYLIYNTGAGSFTVNLSAAPSTKWFDVEWFDTLDGSVTAGTPVKGGPSSQSFTAPDGEKVLYLKQKKPPL